MGDPTHNNGDRGRGGKKGVPLPHHAGNNGLREAGISLESIIAGQHTQNVQKLVGGKKGGLPTGQGQPCEKLNGRHNDSIEVCPVKTAGPRHIKESTLTHTHTHTYTHTQTPK